MDKIKEYIERRDRQIKENMLDEELANATYRFTRQLVRTDYVRNFTWMGIPILQYPSDLMVMQELIYQVQPDVLIEIGVGYGGMFQFYDSVLKGVTGGQLIGIDLHRPTEIPYLAEFFRGSSIDEKLFKEVTKFIGTMELSLSTMVCLDSMHTHEHVFKELELYAPLVSVGSYIIVFDTAIEYFGHLDKNQDRPWGRGNNPATAVIEFLKTEMGQNFEVDRGVEQRALITSAPGGFLRRIK